MYVCMNRQLSVLLYVYNNYTNNKKLITRLGFQVYFGGFDIPAGFVAPKPQKIGKFSELAHGVSSGEVTVLDDRTIRIEGLNYDGQGPGKFTVSILSAQCLFGQCLPAVSVCSVNLQCLSAVFICSIHLQCSSAEFICSVYLQCLSAVFNCSIQLQYLSAVSTCSVCLQYLPAVTACNVHLKYPSAILVCMYARLQSSPAVKGLKKALERKSKHQRLYRKK